MILATAHLPPFVSISAAVAALLCIAMYWRRLGADDVPEARRRIRRASMVVMFFSLIVLVRAFSFVDPDIDPRHYAVTWALAIVLLLLVIFTAFIDVLVNLHVHRRELAAMRAENRARLVEAAQQAREASG